jgi:hypothetical protein
MNSTPQLPTKERLVTEYIESFRDAGLDEEDLPSEAQATKLLIRDYRIVVASRAKRLETIDEGMAGKLEAIFGERRRAVGDLEQSAAILAILEG